MEWNSSASSGASEWNTSVSASNRRADSISQLLAQKNRRIAELEKQLGASRRQVQVQDQMIMSKGHLETSLKKQLEKRDGEIFKLRKENVRLQSKEENWTTEAEKLKEDAINCKAEMEEALKAKNGAEEQMIKMEEEMKELCQRLMDIDEDAIAPASDDDAEEEDESQPKRDYEKELKANEWKKDRPLPEVRLSSSASSASSVVEVVVAKAKMHQRKQDEPHAPSKPGSVVCRCGSCFSSVKGLEQHVRYRNKASAKTTPAKRKANVKDERQSAIARGKPGLGMNGGRGQQLSSTPKRARCSSPDESESEEEPDEEEYEYP